MDKPYPWAIKDTDALWQRTGKDLCKEWNVEQIADSLFSHGMEFMAYKDDEKSKECQDEKHVLIKELKRRIKKDCEK